MPPHILQEIIKRGKPVHKKWARNTLLQTARLEGNREILQRYNLTSEDNGCFRIVKSAQNTNKLLQNETVRQEGNPQTGDPAVDEAYNYMGAAYNFYFDVFNRNSYDNQGGKLIATVHYGKNFDNAYWNGEEQVFGDGDGKIFQRFTICPEIIGHETAHGVTQLGANLTYEDESGALNEANSDVFGCLIKQHQLNQKARKADWIIGAGLLEPSIKGVGIRSLIAPGTAYDDPLLGKDPCPATMSNYVNTKQDNGGIHINCTIPSHAFYVSAVELGGYAWEKMGRIWYQTVTEVAKKNSTFETWTKSTLQVARKLFGAGSPEVKATQKGWRAVGLA